MMARIDLSDARAVASAVALDLFRGRRLCSAVALELGMEDGRRLDAVGLNHWGEVYVAEVKVSRSDWLANRDKIPAYREYADWLYVAAPAGLIPPDEFRAWRRERVHARDIGLVEVAPSGACTITAGAKRLRPIMERRIGLIWRMAVRGSNPDFCPRCGWRASAIREGAA